MKKITFLPLVVGFSLLTSCASLVEGSPAGNDPRCSFETDKRNWYINETPGLHPNHQTNKNLSSLRCQQYNKVDDQVLTIKKS